MASVVSKRKSNNPPAVLSRSSAQFVAITSPVKKKIRVARLRLSTHTSIANIDEDSNELNEPPEILRRKAVTCLDFGKDRRVKYHDAFFCLSCDDWENCHVVNSRAKRDSVRFRCKANHSSLSTPMKKINKENWSHGIAITNAGIETEQEQAPVSVSASPKAEICRLKKIVEVASELEKVKLQLTLLEVKNDALNAQLNAKDALLKQVSENAKRFKQELEDAKRTIKLEKEKVKREQNKVARLETEKKDQKPQSLREGVQSALDELINAYYNRFCLKNLLKDISQAIKKGRVTRWERKSENFFHLPFENSTTENAYHLHSASFKSLFFI